ncbi:MAG: alpha/beta fold hydrolase [Pseudonocardiaceae bacterium]
MARPTFVWAHGLLSSVAHEDQAGLFDWSSLEDTARVVRYDTRGHGSADTPYEERAYRWSAMVDDMVHAAGDGPFVAGGVGMGAAVALFAALRAPRRVQGLVLAFPPPAWETRTTTAEAYRSAAIEVEGAGIGGYERWLADQPQPPVRVAVHHLRRMEHTVVAAILRGAAGSDLPKREELAGIVMPALILASDGPDHPVATARHLSDLLVLSDLHVAPGLTSTRSWPALVRTHLTGIPQWE